MHTFDSPRWRACSIQPTGAQLERRERSPGRRPPGGPTCLPGTHCSARWVHLLGLDRSPGIRDARTGQVNDHAGDPARPTTGWRSGMALPGASVFRTPLGDVGVEVPPELTHAWW